MAALHDYLARLLDPARPASRIWLAHEGQAHGRFFDCTMTSAFQPIRHIDSGAAIGYEGVARAVHARDVGLSLWKLLDSAASDDESVELDRLCRMLHAINFFRQRAAGDADLYLRVHDRLLSAVSGDHGRAFLRILDGLGLSVDRIVLQLSAINANQGWLLSYVADNYRRNGFRIALRVASPAQGLALLAHVRPVALKLDARRLGDAGALRELFQRCEAGAASVIFKHADDAQALDIIRRAHADSGAAVFIQGGVADLSLPFSAAACFGVLAQDPSYSRGNRGGSGDVDSNWFGLSDLNFARSA